MVSDYSRLQRIKDIPFLTSLSSTAFYLLVERVQCNTKRKLTELDLTVIALNHDFLYPVPL